LIPIGLLAGITELIVGIPLAFVTAQELGRFSLFALAPIASLALVVVLIIPNLWQKWTGTTV
jgi:fumarate reductase subunit D